MSRAQDGRPKQGGRNASRSRKARKQKVTSLDDEMRTLETRCQEVAASKSVLRRFDELPITARTATGLKRAAFVDMTDIQAKALPLALAGKDILGAARTGSGKTLAFVVPVLERLYKEKWGPSDGLGALILSPTRELAIQIFEVLRKIGTAHTFSAGLVIGGKDVKVEKERLTRMNIVVATPGRLLQHMDQTAGFDASNVQVLVLDEADRCMDMGFENTLDAILDNLPKHGRQTLLFSATQAKRVRDLARLSLSSPEYVAVHDETSKQGLMPASLQQHYMVVPLPQKLSVLFSFIRTHLRSKVLVFFSACRQVQFAHETFRKMRPGVPLMCLHGKQKQTKRLDIFNAFTRSQHAVLLATDIAARGLDFPKVDWVIQVDAPEDADTYVHRVGRTARYTSKGNSLMFVLPSEEKGISTSLKAKGITPDVIKPKESKVHDIRDQLQGFLFQEPELKYLGQKAFVSYVRSIYLQRDKATFDVTQLPIESYAESLGLPGAPKMKFVKEAQAAKKKAERMLAKDRASASAAQDGAADGGQGLNGPTGPDGRLRTKYDRMFERKNQGVLSEHYRGLIADDQNGSSDEEDVDEDGSGGKVGTKASGGKTEASDSGDSDEDGSSDEEEGPRYKQAGTHESQSSDQSEEESVIPLISHNGTNDDDADDFITLKRADHGLDKDDLQDAETHLSKRKLQLGASKKRAAAAGMRGLGEKVVYDDEGRPHKVYEMQDEEDFRTASGDNAREAADAFMSRERALLQERDVEDKERVREKRREKKLRQREREQHERGIESDDDEHGGAVFVAPEDTRDDGYETPDFDLRDASGSNDNGDDTDWDADPDGAQEQSDKDFEDDQRPSKRYKRGPANLEADEDLALRLLGS